MTEIKRPDVVYDDAKHTYTLNGEKLLGVSTVAKVGDDEVWGVASAWAFRIGYEGAFDLYEAAGEDGLLPCSFGTKDELREALKQARKTPWHKSDSAKDRGNAIHDALEQLAQTGKVPMLSDFPEGERGYIQALCKWYVDYRPKFVATEVVVVSEQYMYAGRYDLRVSIAVPILQEHGYEMDGPLCLVDLKTGKRPYPTTQFPQLAGYELAGVEMGYPATDAQFVLNVHDDGTYEFVRSCATAEHFLAYLAAQRAILDIKTKSKPPRKKKA